MTTALVRLAISYVTRDITNTARMIGTVQYHPTYEEVKWCLTKKKMNISQIYKRMKDEHPFILQLCWIRYLWLEKGHTGKEIAKITGATHGTILGWIGRYGMSKRDVKARGWKVTGLINDTRGRPRKKPLTVVGGKVVVSTDKKLTGYSYRPKALPSPESVKPNIVVDHKGFVTHINGRSIYFR